MWSLTLSKYLIVLYSPLVLYGFSLAYPDCQHHYSYTVKPRLSITSAIRAETHNIQRTSLTPASCV